MVRLFEGDEMVREFVSCGSMIKETIKICRYIVTLFKQYPAWNMIGGKIILKNISGSNVAFRSISFCSTLTISPLKL